MKQHIAHIALVVDDYDEAIQFYTEKLNFDLVEDTVLTETKRWVLVRPKGATECCLLLAKAVGDEQKNCVGNRINSSANSSILIILWYRRETGTTSLTNRKSRF